MRGSSANDVQSSARNNIEAPVGYGWLVICAIIFALILLPIAIL